MDWLQLISARRFGLEDYVPAHGGHYEVRTEFQRDFDRLVFSAPFRRLQNKTQVFPLPGSVFVHNRLTHSLEVACVGRSMGGDVARELMRRHAALEGSLVGEIGAIVSAACLAHDLGNPPFGHSGERAISTYFSEGRGGELREQMGEGLWQDAVHFEGNANAFRLLTHQFVGRRRGGFVLTYSTLAAIVKYPYESRLAGRKSKFGFFATEAESFCRIAGELGMRRMDEPSGGIRYARHPLVYLVEAADDICYQLMDIEDAHKLKLLTTEATKELLFGFFSAERREHMQHTLALVDDANEQIAYLRSSAIGLLTHECAQAFLAHEEDILAGEFTGTLIGHIGERPLQAYQRCSEVAQSRIYRSRDVLDIELAGFRIIGTLLELMIDAVRWPDRAYSRLLIDRVSSQYDIRSADLPTRIRAVLDYISGMTDVFALDLYRKINGTRLPDL